MHNALQRSFAARERSPAYFRFRAMPTEAQRGAVRRLALSGFAEQDIAAKTGLSMDVVRRTIRDDDCLQTLATMTNGFAPGRARL